MKLKNEIVKIFFLAIQLQLMLLRHNQMNNLRVQFKITTLYLGMILLKWELLLHRQIGEQIQTLMKI